MYNVIGALRGCRAVKLDSCNNLLSSIHTITCYHSAVCQIEYKNENIIYTIPVVTMIVYSVLNNNKNNNNDDNNSNNNNNMWNIYETTVLFQDLALTVQHFNAFEELSPNSDKF